MKKNLRKTLLLILVLCALSGCEGEKAGEGAVLPVSKEDCFLCGRKAEGAWGWNDLGIVSLNTFDMLPVEINRYNEAGELLAEQTGKAVMRSFQSGENGFCAVGIEDSDRGYAIMSVTLGEDKKADRDRTAAFLCGECLERVLPEERREIAALGVVDLTTGEVRALDRGTSGFGLGDFYVYCDWKDGGKKVDLVLFYSPPRYT